MAMKPHYIFIILAVGWWFWATQKPPDKPISIDQRVVLDNTEQCSLYGPCETIKFHCYDEKGATVKMESMQQMLECHRIRFYCTRRNE